MRYYLLAILLINITRNEKRMLQESETKLLKILEEKFSKPNLFEEDKLLTSLLDMRIKFAR